MPDATHPDDPCPCSSGLRYRDCHQEINEAAPNRLLDIGRRNYAERWQGNASAYEAQGVYRQLTEHLRSFGNVSRVIDVGCGRGEGLTALRDTMVSEDYVLVGLDENPDCLHAAAQNLNIDSPPARLRRVGLSGRQYDLEVLPGKLSPLGRVTLIQTDLLRDDSEADALLVAARPYDAVILWFTGIHPAREHDLQIKRLKITSDRLHRMATDLAALDLACALVHPGGCFHVVTRGVTNDRLVLQAEVESEMRALATHGSVELLDVQLMPYKEPSSGKRIGTAGPGYTSADGQTFAASCMFRVFEGSAN